MATTTEPVEAPQAPPGEPDGDRSTRRMLKGLFIILALAAVALLFLLFWLLRPEDSGPPAGQPAGYPIEVVTTIYGFGEAANEQITQPLGVTLDAEGNVWVSNTGRSRVEVYTRDGDFIRTLGDQEGDGKLFTPYGITVDAERGLVYVADMSGRNVQIYTTLGDYAGHLPADDQELAIFGDDGFTPYDVELSPDGRIVVSSADGLYFFDQEGSVVARWGGTAHGQNLRGPWDGVFNFPDSFAIDPESGWIYVADTANRRVIGIDPDGFWKWVSGAPDEEGKIASFWQLPRSISIGPDDGNLYVVDTFRFDPEGMGTGHIVVLSKDGELLSEFGRAGSVDGAFSYPDQMEAGPDGLWAIADRENNRVVVFRLITPYPEVDDLLAARYPKTFDEPEFTWVTPPPTPPIDGEG
jgi:DNA-binding beta-propeller fold protein YncE